MRKHYYSANIFRLTIACLLALVMLSTSVSGYFADSVKAKTEWTKNILMPAVVSDIFTICDVKTVAPVVIPSITSKGVMPEREARCRSPGITYTSV